MVNGAIFILSAYMRMVKCAMAGWMQPCVDEKPEEIHLVPVVPKYGFSWQHCWSDAQQWTLTSTLPNVDDIELADGPGSPRRWSVGAFEKRRAGYADGMT
jgi:hypothetical protein